MDATADASPGFPSAEIARVDPGLLYHRPPIDGQSAGYIVVRQPAIAGFAPPRAPGVADQQGAGGFVRTRARVLDFYAIVIAHRHDGVPADDPLAARRKRDLPA